MNIKEFLIEKIKVRLGDKKAIVGVSGGVDSAVVASLCVRALGKDNVELITMPYGEQDMTNAFLLARALDLPIIKRNIDTIVDHIYSLVNSTFNCTLVKQDTLISRDIPRDFDKKLVLGNIMARERMVLLYALANMLDGYVMGTGNFSELEVGYYTKYGDGAVDFEVLGNLFKSEVYNLARELEIPREIIEAKPSAGLWEGQTDEEEMGITYDDIELVLKNKLPMDDKRVKKVLEMQKAAFHKNFAIERF